MLWGGNVSVRTQGGLFVSVILKHEHTELADVNVTIDVGNISYQIGNCLFIMLYPFTTKG